ncbi:hypothetical protein J2W14_002905 [Pseudarthrobacter oxydans]|uniref:hypothetical protein n=1 Tax=Pseudarthrobacter oxydans TaxID=1671 RepID=UPI00277DC644|nr:hypothetical protein [Pseudarthrobacter oxydans]MDP9983484.1 hypothetical protein [Pseudarthrobacter oxydans]
MPHLLRSTTSPATRPSKSSPESRPPEHRRSPEADRAHHIDPDLGPLRRQVSAIIDAILSDTTPDEAQVRERLSWHVANNPGQPEKALLGHLLSVSEEQAAGY